MDPAQWKATAILLSLKTGKRKGRGEEGNGKGESETEPELSDALMGVSTIYLTGSRITRRSGHT